MSPRLVIDGVAVGLLIGCVVLLVEGGGEIHLGHLLGTRRSSGLLGWYNHNIADDIYMALAILSAVVGSSMLSRQRSAVTIGAAILFTVIFVYAVAFIVQGQSRGAWVAIAFASLVVWCVFRRSAAKTLGLYALVALVIILLKYGVIFDRAGGAAIIAPAAAQSVLAQGTATSIAPERNVVELHSIDARLRLWQAGIELIQKQPIRGYFGWDWEQIRKDTSFRKLLQTFPHLHNLWIEAAVRFGLFYSLGLGIAMMVVLSFLLRCGLELREADPHAAALGAGTAFYFLFFLSENAFDLNLPQKEVMNIALMFAALAGFATSQAAWPASRNSAQPVVRSS